MQDFPIRFQQCPKRFTVKIGKIINFTRDHLRSTEEVVEPIRVWQRRGRRSSPW